MGHQLIQQAFNRWRAILTTEGAKFAVSSSRVPLTEYIAVTKRICDELGENTTGKDCTEIYQKTKRSCTATKRRNPSLKTSPKRRGRHQNPQGRCSRVVLTADKGVALVVMDKSQYVNKCMALLDDTKVYKPCKDTTKKLHRDIQETLRQLNRDHGSSRLYWWSKKYYNKLLPTGNTSPAPRSTVYQKSTRLIAPCDP